jgi:hypothetical protein
MKNISGEKGQSFPSFIADEHDYVDIILIDGKEKIQDRCEWALIDGMNILNTNKLQGYMNMDTLNNNSVNILDLPDEILLLILSKLRMIGTLYSLVNVDGRFDRLALDPVCIRHVDLTTSSLPNRNSLVYNEIFDRIRTRIFPQIHRQVTKLTIEPCSTKCILDTVDYPALTSLSLVNFQSDTLFVYLLGKI